MSILQNSFAAAQATIRAIAGVTIQYVGPDRSLSIPGAVSEITTYELSNGETIIETWTGRDYLVAASALSVNGVLVPPRDGEKIQETIGGILKTFALFATPQNPIFEFTDPGQTQLRIRTKEVE